MNLYINRIRKMKFLTDIHEYSLSADLMNFTLPTFIDKEKAIKIYETFEKMDSNMALNDWDPSKQEQDEAWKLLYKRWSTLCAQEASR